MSQFYPIPDNYTSPEWPGLSLEKPVILYYGLDLWLFITLWTTVLTASCYFFAFLWSYAAYYKIRWYFVVPILATIIGAIIGFVSGSIIGLFIALIFTTGKLAMPSWVALAWGILNVSSVLLGAMLTWSSIL